MTRAVPLPPTVKGWCPGALRPMETGDGLLVRVRKTAGRWVPDEWRALAGLARRYGNGLVDLSQRSNLQLRGVSTARLPDLWTDLRALALLDADAEAESVRNVIGPPLSGCDPTAVIDGFALASRLEAMLAADRSLHNLPDKFGFLVDQGGALPLGDVGADIRLVGTPNGILVQLGGDEASARTIARASPDTAADIAVALARAFLSLAGRSDPPARRMAALLARDGVPDHLADEAGLALAVFADDVRPLPVAPPALGPRVGFALVGVPFGRLDADQMDAIAAVAPTDIRVTPWRALALPGAGTDHLAALGTIGLAVAPDDPRLSVVACPGSACSSGEVDARAIALRIAPLTHALGHRPSAPVHVSGCAKGCARPHAAPLVFVGRDGRLDLVEDGRADGSPIRVGLSVDAAEAVLVQRLEEKERP